MLLAQAHKQAAACMYLASQAKAQAQLTSQQRLRKLNQRSKAHRLVLQVLQRIRRQAALRKQISLRVAIISTFLLFYVNKQTN